MHATVRRRASLLGESHDGANLPFVVTTCSGCGTVTVSLGSKVLATVHLSATSTHKRVVVPVDLSSGVKTGTVTIRQASGGKPVTIDGIAVSLSDG